MDFCNNNTRITVECKFCFQQYDILCNKEDLESWKEGSGYIQDVLAYLSAAEREMLISQICDKCWKRMFGEEEEQEEEGE